MEAKTNIRRLLAGTSFVALLAASDAVLAAGVTVNTPRTTPLVQVTAVDFIEVTPSGKITVSNSSDPAIGILVSDEGSVSGDIENSGQIKATGVNAAAGILVIDGGEVGGDIVNSESGVIIAHATDQSASAEAFAGGMLADVSTIYGDIVNEGSISARAKANANVNVTDSDSAHALGTAFAIASGIGAGWIGLPDTGGHVDHIMGSVGNAAGAELVVRALAAANNHAVATGSTATGGAEAVASAERVMALAYGVISDAGPSGTIDGAVVNMGEVAVVAKATAANYAEAHGVDGVFHDDHDAVANAIGSAYAGAIGIGAWADAMGTAGSSMAGYIANVGELNVLAQALTTNTAIADASAGQAASASAFGMAEAQAAGIKNGVSSLTGGMLNMGAVEVIAGAGSRNTAQVIDEENAYERGSASASGAASAEAVGMKMGDLTGTPSGLVFAGDYSVFPVAFNGGSLEISAVGAVQNQAVVNINAGPATAEAGAEDLQARAAAGGMVLAGTGVFAAGSSGASYAIGNGGMILAEATAQMSNSALASGTSLAVANAAGQVTAVAAGVDIRFDEVAGQVENRGEINANALGLLQNVASATVAGGDATASATGGAMSYAAGFVAQVNTLTGDFINFGSGTIDVNASAGVANSAIAAGTSLNIGDVSALASGAAFAQALGFGLVDNSDSSTIFGDIRNAGTIDVSVAASTTNYASAENGFGDVDASARSGGDKMPNASARGIFVAVDGVEGDVDNSDNVSVSAAARAMNSAMASALGGGAANAAASGLQIATADGILIDVDHVGDIGNSGTIEVSAVASIGNYAEANAAEGDAQASVYGSANAIANGLVVDTYSILGGVENSGDIRVSAVAGAWNGDAVVGGSTLMGADTSFLGFALADLDSFTHPGQGGAFAAGTGSVSASATGDAYAQAVGLSVYASSTISGDIANSGDIYAAAFAVTTNGAHAFVSDHGEANAAARGQGAVAEATGVSIYAQELGGGVDNIGSTSFGGAAINVAAIAGSLNHAVASGSASGTTLSLVDASAVASGSAFAFGHGLSIVSDQRLDGNVSNNGEISVLAAAGTFNSADARTSNGNATAQARDVNLTIASATGLNVSAGTLLGSIENAGDIQAVAFGLSYNDAIALASSYNGSARASATGAADVQALGINAGGSILMDSFVNEGDIEAIAAAMIDDEALASGYDARAEARNYSGSAIATGINIDLNSVGGAISNTGDVNVMAAVMADNSAEANGVGSADAEASGEANALARGIFVDVPMVNGGTDYDYSFSNSGDIHVAALAQLQNSANANASGGDAWATASGTNVEATATGIRIIGGNFNGTIFNDGDIFVSAIGNSINSASVVASDDAKAVAIGSAYAYANGIDFYSTGSSYGYSEVDGDLLNEGDITVGATALVSNIASAEGDRAWAYAGLDDDGDEYNRANASAYGFYGDFSTIFGNFENSGDITVSANAVSRNEATAQGVADANASASASASATAVGLEIDAYSISGDVTNSGAITVSAAAITTSKANAVAQSGSAVAYAYMDTASAEATGLSVDVETIAGSFSNSGDISVHSTAAAIISATATGRGYAYAYGSADDVDADAVGVDFWAYSLGGDFTNTGDITVVADASYAVTAKAKALESGDAYADIGAWSAEATATGLYVRIQDVLEGNFDNSGAISVHAIASVSSHATATGVGFARATAESSAAADAIGISFYANSMGGNFTNSGAVTVKAEAIGHTSAKASGQESRAYGSDEGDSESYAEAVGIEAEFWGYFSGSFINEAAVKATASAKNYSRGEAISTGVSSARATAESSASAEAVGISISTHYAPVAGNIENSSSIEAVANAFASAIAIGARSYASASANASAVGLQVDSWSSIEGQFSNGTLATLSDDDATQPSIKALAIAQAKADGGSGTAEAYADAIGVSFYVDGTLGGGFSNSGDIVGEALATATGIDEAIASATATGVYLNASGVGDLIFNEGLIRAAASANAEATADGYARGFAQAKGLDLNVYGDVDGGIYNLGTVEALAIVHATPVTTGVGSAYATAIYAHVTGEVLPYGSETSIALGNAGLIRAAAVDPIYAKARGLVVNDGTYRGDLVNFETIEVHATATADGGSANATALTLENGVVFEGELVNSGVIAAFAKGDNANATAIRITGGSHIYDGIVNGGVIAAIATGEDVSTVAIDLDGAGSGHTIDQIGGELEYSGIYGDIRMLNGQSDLINWSGGKIGGELGDTTIHSNIYGDSNDSLNVFAGTDSEFDFADDIQGLRTINVNMGDPEADAVKLTVSGNIGTNKTDYQAIQNFNVNANGTLVLQPTAQIDVANFRVAGSEDEGPAGTVQWNLKPSVPQHGTITAGSATIGEGANSIAHALPGLFNANNDFLVLKSEDITGTFNFSHTFTNLYTVTDAYRNDGYHIVITRMAFGEIPGLDNDGANAGRAIDRILDWLNENDPEGDLATKLGEILTGTPEEYARNLNELAGSQNADLIQVALTQPDRLFNVIFDQLTNGGGGTALADLGALVKLAANQPGDVMSDAGPQYASLVKPSPVANPGTIWARAFGNWSSLDRSAGASGFTSNGGGLVVGADYRFTDNFKAGLAGGFQKDDVDFRGAGKADVKSWSVGAYGRYEVGSLYMNAMLGYGHQSYSMERRFTVLGTSYSAHRSPDGSSVSAGAEIGYAFDLGNDAKLSPFAGLLYTHTKMDGSTETGASPFNLTLDDQTANTANSRIGVRWAQTFRSGGGTEWTPQLALGWRHAFGDQNPSTTASLAGIPGSAFTVTGANAARDAAIVGAGVTLKLSEGIDGTVEYNGDFSSNYTDSTASLRLRLKF